MDFPRSLRSTGSAGDLDDELRRALRCPKIRTHEPAVRVDHRDQRYVWKVVTFCQHLSPDENCRIARFDRREMFLQPALAARGVAVDSEQRDVRKALRERLFGALGAHADSDQSCVVTLGATIHRRLAIATMVAD